MKKTIIITGILALALAGSTFAATGSDLSGSMTKPEKKAIIANAKTQIQANRTIAKAQMKDYVAAFHQDAGYVTNYFAKLTDKTAAKARNTAVKAAQTALQSSRDQLLKDYLAAVKAKTPMTMDAITARITTMISTFHDAVVSYVDPAKSTQFEAFIQGKQEVIVQNYQTRETTRTANQAVRASAKAQIKGTN